MNEPGTYTSIFALLRDWLRVNLDVPAVRPETNGLPPRNLATNLPLVVITQVGGTDINIVVDQATVSLDTYAADADTAEQLANRIRTAIRLRLTGYMLADKSAWVKDVRVVSSPKPLPYDNTAIGRSGAVYQISVRTQL